MKKTRMCKALLAGTIAVLLLVGCAAPAPHRDVITGDLMAQLERTAWPEPPNTLDPQYQRALFDFAWDLFQRSAAEDGNVLISPASVYLAIAMTYNGASGETQQAMLEGLKASGLSQEAFNQASRDYLSILRTTGEKTELAIANAIWYREGFEPALLFLQKNADYFDAAARSLDFKDPAAADLINAWVSEQTRGTIDKIIEEIHEDAMLYLMNAVYFKSIWQHPFDPNDNVKYGFETPDGSVTTDFMHRIGDMEIIQHNGAKGVLLPYDNGRFQFFAVLPPADTEVRSFIQGLDGIGIQRLLASVRTENIKLGLPKFEIRYEDSLNEILSAMGMEIAFNPGLADFSAMSADGSRNLYIEEVKHKSFIRVDEEGTEASAVTSVEMRLTSMPLEPDTQIIFDRPFIFGIADTLTGAPLFVGILEDPEA